MSDLKDWLATLGLERYATAFAKVEVDLETLPYLTEADLKEIGLPVGPRRRVLAALASAVPQDCALGAPQRSSESPATAPERRQITVMFVDLVGSTRLSAELDPEVLADLMTSYKDVVSREIAAAGGWVAKYLGDGVLAYFGWPQGREDAAESSVRCGFQVVEQVARLSTPDKRALQCRIGIATGLVVVGGEVGKGTAREDAIAGEAPNLAARLQGLALPDTIVISEGTHRQLGELFECEALGEQVVNGFAAPVRAWRPIRASAHASRFQAARAVRTSFVGRRHELSLLKDRWRTAGEGKSRAVLILGEAGMGKSRLVSALHDEIVDQAHKFVTWQCSPYHQAKPLYPVVEYIIQTAGIVDATPPEDRLRKLTDLLAACGMPVESALPLFAQLMGIPPEAGYRPPTLGPTQLRAATIANLNEWIRRVAAQYPILLLIEDAHWSDPTTLELAVLIVGSANDTSLMTVITARPEFMSPWRGQADVSLIGLDRLNDPDCEGLVRELVVAAALQSAVVKEIVSRGDGNPLFLEELSAAVFDTRAGGPVVPDSLQSSLMARLDRLGEAKQTAQVCSVLGRRFARPLLILVSGLPHEVLDSYLSLLVAHDVIRPLGSVSEGRFDFKHALLRDAAYESLLLSQRRRLHEACGRSLEQAFPEVARTEPELLAQHFGQAGLSAEASRYWEQAGDRATASGAVGEVVATYQQAVRQNELCPEGLERDRRTLALLLKLGPAISIIEGAQAPQLRDLYKRAEHLSRAVGNRDALFKSVWGLWYHANIARDLDDAADFAQELVHISQQSGDEDHTLEALHCRWSSALFRGDYLACGADAKRGAELYDKERHSKLGLIFGGHDPGVCALQIRGQALVWAGEIEPGLDLVALAIALAEALNHPPSLAHGLLGGLIVTTVIPATDLVQTYAVRMLDLGRQFNVPPQQAVGAYHLAWVEAMTADRSKGLEKMAALFDRVTAIGPVFLLYKAMYIDQLFRAGRNDEALSVADKAVTGLRFPETGFLLCELYRLRGVCLAAKGRKEEAVMELLRAEAMAARGGAALLRLRAATNLHRTEAAERSRDVLRTALAAAPAGLQVVDFAEAEAVLATLA